jgi:hypothetical protein
MFFFIVLFRRRINLIYDFCSIKWRIVRSEIIDFRILILFFLKPISELFIWLSFRSIEHFLIINIQSSVSLSSRWDRGIVNTKNFQFSNAYELENWISNGFFQDHAIRTNWRIGIFLYPMRFVRIGELGFFCNSGRILWFRY